MSETQQWEPCESIEVGETLRWNEPLWAAPNKPRGKRDKIGEQEIIGELIGIEDILEFKVVSIKKLSGDNAILSVKENDYIRRKQSSVEKGDCYKLVES